MLEFQLWPQRFAVKTCVSGWNAYQANQKAITDGIGRPSASVTEALRVRVLKRMRTFCPLIWSVRGPFTFFNSANGYALNAPLTSIPSTHSLGWYLGSKCLVSNARSALWA